MFAIVRQYSGSPDLVDALLENESAIRNVIQGIDGFRAYYLVRTTDGWRIQKTTMEGGFSIALEELHGNLNTLPAVMAERATRRPS